MGKKDPQNMVQSILIKMEGCRKDYLWVPNQGRPRNGQWTAEFFEGSTYIYQTVPDAWMVRFWWGPSYVELRIMSRNYVWPCFIGYSWFGPPWTIWEIYHYGYFTGQKVIALPADDLDPDSNLDEDALLVAPAAPSIVTRCKSLKTFLELMPGGGSDHRRYARRADGTRVYVRR